MTFSYSKYFTIELLHEYFLSRKCTGLQLVPAEDTKALAKRMGLQFRPAENGLHAFLRDNGSKGPFLSNEKEASFRHSFGKDVLRFYITPADPLFFNYTNLPTANLTGSTFYFSNLSQNAAHGKRYLSRPINTYAPGTTYLPGDYAKDPDTGRVYEAIAKQVTRKKNPLTEEAFWQPKGLLHLPKKIEEFKPGKYYTAGELVRKPDKDEVYEALEKHSAGSKTALNEASTWMARGEGQLEYVSSEDLLDHTNGNYVFELKDPAKKLEIRIFGFNFRADQPGYDRPVRDPATITFPAAVNKMKVDLTSLPPGKYQVDINKETKLVYVDPGMAGNILGVIEIFNHLPGKDDFSLLTEKDVFRNASYQVQFAARSVLWKYIRKDGKAVSISDTGDTGYLFNLLGDVFVSATPIPLSETALKTLQLDFNTKDFSMSPLPNPGIQRLGTCNQNEYDYFCSEVFLNY